MGRKPKTPETEWEERKQDIERIYMTEQRSLKTLSEGMASLCGFIASDKEYRRHFKKWGWIKNNLDQAPSLNINHNPQQDRKRVAQALPPQAIKQTSSSQVFQCRQAPEFRWHADIERELWRIKAATDTIIYGSFGSGKERWIADKVSLIAPSSHLDNSQQWIHLESQCSAIVALAETGIHAQVRGSLEQLFQTVERLKSTIKPNSFIPQLVCIWRVCLNLFKARLPLPRLTSADGLRVLLSINPLAPRFIQKLEDHLTSTFGKRNPICEIMAALLAIFRHTPDKFKLALECGYFMTIKGFEGIVGNYHPVVLRMWSHYSRVWGRNVFYDVDKIDEAFQHINWQLHESLVQDVPESIPILLSFTEMSFAKESAKLGNLSQYYALMPYSSRPTRLEDFALELRQRAMVILQNFGGLSDGAILDAFVFSTDLLALRLFVRLNPDFSLEILNEAIQLLQQGGTECLIWASKFSKDRLKLLETKEKADDFYAEKVRMTSIRSKLPTVKPELAKPAGSVSTERTRFLRARRRKGTDKMVEYLQSMLDGFFQSSQDNSEE
ncbi:uncharacterized protein BKA55DRAFT_585251 [Fusarium redolens]|uniref:Clr5 domain-containing protein n=1 Tax=Fusarium redolens TaxID=48865 RepID=A0A9P9JL26_FUSRE|nr:uncharacterized protein BKA55DRAFT_585251 [Fusarium redolens]KAH7216986.1 hypothetical protein BKA55DRAFT_585251 [Fusarium redolens]